MERIFKPYDKEYMRMAMLKHEETFKEQVYELHRLYRIQKILMKRIENSSSNKPAGGSVMKQMKSSCDNRILEMIDESEIDLSLGLGPSSYNPRKKAETTPLNSDCGPSSFSSSSTGSSHVHRTSSESGGSELRLVKLPSNINRTSSVHVEEEQVRQEKLKQQPNWLYQVLSLNMST